MEYTQEHLLGAYIQNTLELEDMTPDQQESDYAEEIRENMEEIWELMDDYTHNVATDIAARLGTFTLVRQCTQRHADIMAIRMNYTQQVEQDYE